MTNFAPVAPLVVHRQLDQAHILSTYNLVIASEVLKDPIGYRDFWSLGKRHDYPYGLLPTDGRTLIMDNGIIELGYPLPVKELALAAEIVHADILILPDTIDDQRMTIKQVRHTNPEWKKLRLPTRTMGVVQGKTFAECVDCADSHVQAGVDYLAVPRGLTPTLGSRYDLVSHIAAEHPHTPIHLLGFSENIHDDIHAAVASPIVMGIDAATPVWLGMGGRKALLPPEPPRTANYGRRPEWFWNASEQEGDSLRAVISNLAMIEFWLQEANDAAALLRGNTYLGQSAAKDAHTRGVARLAKADPPTQP